METEALVKQAESQSIAVKGDIAVLVAQEAGLTITDSGTFGKAGDILKWAKAKEKWLDEDRKKITKHFDDAKDIVMAKYAPQVDEVKGLKNRITQKMKDFEIEEQAREAEAERKRKEAALAILKENQKEIEAEALKTNNADLLDAAVDNEQFIKQEEAAPIEPVAVKSYGGFSRTSFRDNWKFEVINEAIVPVQYKTTDKDKVNSFIKKGVREIPGLRIYNDKIPLSK
jgi:hypothetical protein